MIYFRAWKILANLKNPICSGKFSQTLKTKGLNPHLYDHLNLFLKSQKQNAAVPPRLKASDMNLSRIIDL